MPYPGEKLGKVISFEEVEDDYGNSYLQIYAFSPTFTLEDYYQDLAKSGWNIIKGYDGKAVQNVGEGVKLVESTKVYDDNETGYDLMYYYVEAVNKGGTYAPGHHIIRCYADLDPAKSDATSWSDSEKEDMLYALGTELPFIKMGSINRVYAYASNYFKMLDISTTDSTTDYKDMLIADGFVYDETVSADYGAYYLTKTFSNGNVIEALLTYFGGNEFDFFFTPKVTTYTSWPSELLKTIQDTSGVTIPQFTSTDGKYYAYEKGGAVYIQGLTNEEDDGYMDSYLYGEELSALGMTVSGWDDPYVNWDETIAIDCADVTDDEYNYIGLEVSTWLTEPSSNFSDNYPNDKVDDFIKNVLGIEDFTLPFLNDLSSYTDNKIKYEVYGQDYVDEYYEYYIDEITEDPSFYEDQLPEDYTDADIEALAKELALNEAYIVINVKDKDELATATAFDNLFQGLAYHQKGAWQGTSYEDKDGKIEVNVDGVWYEDYGYGTSTITIKKGSGEAHEPVLEFGSTAYTIGIGKNQKLQLTKDMLPYDVTYKAEGATSITVNNNGYVFVSSEANDGDTATITAALTDKDGKVYTATCTITAKEILDYSKDSTIDWIEKALQSKGYTNYERGTELDYYHNENPFIKMTFDTSSDTTVTADGLMTFTNENLIPTGFEPNWGVDPDTFDEVEGKWGNASMYEDGEEIGKGTTLNCTFTYEDDEFAKVGIIFYVYTLNDSPNTLIFKVTAMDVDII